MTTTVTPYLSVHDASSAIDFYEQAFGAVEEMRLAEPTGKVGHAEIRIDGARIMLADEYPDYGFVGPQKLGGSPVTIVLEVADVDAFVARAAEAGATIVRPVKDEFYGERSGSLQDPFGHRWLVSTRTEKLTPDELQRRFAELVKS